MFDLELRELLTVSVQATIAFAAFFLEDDDVLTLDERIHHFANHFGTFDGGSAHSHCSIGIDEENFVELDSVAFLLVVSEEVDKQFLAGLGTELLSLNFYNCVHLNNCITSWSVRRPVLCAGTYLCLSE